MKREDVLSIADQITEAIFDLADTDKGLVRDRAQKRVEDVLLRELLGSPERSEYFARPAGFVISTKDSEESQAFESFIARRDDEMTAEILHHEDENDRDPFDPQYQPSPGAMMFKDGEFFVWTGQHWQLCTEDGLLVQSTS